MAGMHRDKCGAANVAGLFRVILTSQIAKTDMSSRC